MDTGAIEWHSQIASEFDAKYANRPNFMERHKIWTDIISKYSEQKKEVCDLGCGSGIFSLYAAARNKCVISVDGSAEMIALCERKKKENGIANVKFVCSDIKEFLSDKSKKNSYDIIICSSVIEYFEESDNIFAAMGDALKDDGILLCSIPNADSVYRKLEKKLYDCFRFPEYYKLVKYATNAATLSGKIDKMGFYSLECHYYASTPLLSRMFRAIGIEKYSDNLFLIAARKAGKPFPGTS